MKELICNGCYTHFPLIIENLDKFLKKEDDSLTCSKCGHGYFGIRWDKIRRGVPGID